MAEKEYRKLLKIATSETLPTEKYKYMQKLIDNGSVIKIKPVNYDLFKDFISDRKEAAKVSLAKVKQIEDDTKFKKEATIMKHHSTVWLKEWQRLNSQFKNMEMELNDFSKLLEKNSVDYVDLNIDNDNDPNNTEDSEERRKKILSTDDDDENEYYDMFKTLDQIDELEDYAEQLNNERIKFKVRTIHPINDLIEDLKFYLRKDPVQIKSNTLQNEQISETINLVKEQQNNLLDKLDFDSRRLSQALDEFNKNLNQNELLVTEGIPQQAYDLDSPDDELKISILQEFLIIDFKYKEKLNHLNETHKNLSTSGWTDYEHEMFQHVYEQYNTHNLNLNGAFTVRDLIFDRLKRTFYYLNKTKIDRKDLLKHEEWSHLNKYYHQQQKLIINEWNESRRALLLKAEAVFAEAYELIEKQRIKNEEKEKQLRICNELYDKVSRWRNQKLEALEIQQKIDDMLRKQMMDKLRVENEKKSEQRQRQKQAIAEYNQRLDRNKKLTEQEEQNKLEKIKRSLLEQSEKDKERIDFRNKMFFEKKSEYNQKKQLKQMENEEKEKRLEKFYESVKPNVEADPARLVSFTEAELHRRGIKTNDDTIDNIKIFNSNFSFNDKQLNADARVRIEQRLRQAGLINSEYARTIISTLKSSQSISKRNLNANSNWNGFGMKN